MQEPPTWNPRGSTRLRGNQSSWRATRRCRQKSQPNVADEAPVRRGPHFTHRPNRVPRAVPVKRHRGEPGHTRDTRDTRAHAGTRITRTNLTTIHPNPSGTVPFKDTGEPVKRHRRTSQGGEPVASIVACVINIRIGILTLSQKHTNTQTFIHTQETHRNGSKHLGEPDTQGTHTGIPPGAGCGSGDAGLP